MLSCIHFSNMAMSPQNNEKNVFYTRKLYGLKSMFCLPASCLTIRPDLLTSCHRHGKNGFVCSVPSSHATCARTKGPKTTAYAQ